MQLYLWTTVVLLLCLLNNLLSSVLAQHFEKPRSVWIEQGLIRGLVYKIGKNHMQMFLGIPYAEPPIGENRFKRPTKKLRWHGERSAVDYGAPCVQFMDYNLQDKYAGENMRKNQNEDCLFLNVFAPYKDKEEESRLFPVLVWIHGGSFLAGSGDTGIDRKVAASNLVFRRIVLVTINYRLGAFGFMTHQDKDGKTQGNYGLWDQVEALRWIQHNIRQFGGDPSKVTVMGESAGAASVSALALSPVTSGLLHGAIVMSGSATAGWAIHRPGQGRPKWDVNHVARYLTCDKRFNPEDVQELVKTDAMGGEPELDNCNFVVTPPPCLHDIAPSNSTGILGCFRDQLNFTSFLFRKALTVELGVSKLVVDGELIPTSGAELVRNYSRMPIMIGVARTEWNHKKPQYYGFKKDQPVTKALIHEKLGNIMRHSFQALADTKLANSTLELIGNATYYQYFQSWSANKSVDLMTFVRRLQQVEADMEFVAPAQEEIDGYVSNSLDVYAYVFDYVPSGIISEVDALNVDFFGVRKLVNYEKVKHFETAFHGLDHAFIFSNGYSSNYQVKSFSKRDRIMSALLNRWITNFVKKGDPTPRQAWGMHDDEPQYRSDEPFSDPRSSVPKRAPFKWEKYTTDSPSYAKLSVPPRLDEGELFWPMPTFWNKHMRQVSGYVGTAELKKQRRESSLSEEERLELSAYKRAWWALWLLVAAIAIVLWTVIVCLVVKKCQSPRAKPYDNIVVHTTNNR